MQKYNSRSDVPEKYKWDLSAFYKNDDEFNQEYDKCVELVKRINTYQGCTKDKNKLYEFIKLDEEASSMVENLYVYAYLINDEELGNSKSMERKARAEKLMSDYETAVAFFTPEFLSLDNDMYNDTINDELFKDYKIMLMRIYRVKEHVLSESEEIIINELTSAMDHFDDMSSTMLNSEHDYGTIEIDGETIQITSTNLSKLLKHENRDIRKKVYESYRKVLNQYGVSSSQFLNSYVKGNIAESRLRKYNSCWDKKLFSNNMSDKVYKTLVSVIESNLSHYQDYISIIKDVYNLDTLEYYDLALELSKNGKEYSIEDAWALCEESLRPLGEDYIKHFKKIIDNRYIDYCEYKGKCSGGYSFSTSTQDSRILLSFNNDLDSVSTIIHEAGHNIHHQLVSDNNPIQYRGVTSLVSEVASLTNECLLSSYLAKNGETKDEKLAGIANILRVIDSNLFGAVREGKMEEDFYKYVEEGNIITKDYMDELTKASLDKYYGNTVNKNDYYGLSWIRRSHYYMNFYLYAYSICISIATNVAREILNGNKEMLDNYLKFLKTGGDKWPMEAFSILGVNLEEKSVYENAIKYFNEMKEEYKKLIKEV